jgi:hypothetical protein
MKGYNGIFPLFIFLSKPVSCKGLDLDKYGMDKRKISYLIQNVTRESIKILIPTYS